MKNASRYYFGQLGAVVRRGVLAKGTMAHAEEQAEVDRLGQLTIGFAYFTDWLTENA